MKQTLEDAAEEYVLNPPVLDSGILKSTDNERRAFIAGAEWQTKQSPWISVKDRLPDDNENIIIVCEHGAIFNGTYCNGVWFCMDGYIHDTFRGDPLYSSMVGIPSSWEPVAWMSIPKFNI